ncbi:hypothetical protein [Jiangella alkaliphila]|uniref:Uncharacterized protein n=1 Tax=Jiangella alkaliphila TaxID=419479 RepID=A0A1H2LCQ0_9ACTN|nr:hypothetical protein [Jiangella alkaliphila]SDU78773.1 hypothetical protein SAMN04488563_5856 [Jiangella alkaliphila]
MPEADDDASGGGRADVRELVAVVVLSVTAVLTAWSGFEASKWGGEMSIAFSQASAARIEASRFAAEADAARNFDLDIFGVYVQAVADGDDVLREFVETRFTDHFAVAFDAWTAMSPLENPDAPKGPFALPEYQPPGEAEAVEADARADTLFAKALDNNQRGDDYTLLTVLFALVLFFTAVSQRLRSRTLTWVVLGGAMTLLLVGIGFLIAFPKII